MAGSNGEHPKEHPKEGRESTPLEGVVVRTTGLWHDVKLGSGDLVASRVPGKGRLEGQKSTNPVAVGDRVQITVNDDGTGQIGKVFERANKLSRRAAGRRSGLEHVIAANVDFVWTVQSVALPGFNPGFVDRLLVMTEVGGIAAGIVVNKVDLASTDDLRSSTAFWRDLYLELGYPVIETCALTGYGVDPWFDQIRGKTSVISGPSGVGKSTLINSMAPDLEIRIGEVSPKTRKGRHTTAVAVRYEIALDTFVIDTPGIREIGLWDLEPAELYGYFREMLEPSRQCRFPNCLHDHEPGCGVKAAVKEGAISEERYSSYLNMLESLRQGSADIGR